MLFNSFSFAIFLPIVFILYWLIPDRFRWVLLLIASYYFYMSWNVKYVVLILFTTFISYLASIILSKTDSVVIKKTVVAIAAIASLGVLFVFKYFNFFSESIVNLAKCVSISLHPITLKLLLPVGISFYTFQTLSYVIDVYRGNVEPEQNFGIYATFISFFPQLVAGPIERTSNLLPQIKESKQFDYDEAAYGLKLMAWGFFKKLAIADVISQYVDNVYANISGSTALDILIAIFFFTIQIYCDFSGYSDIAIGTARLFGIRLMKNFSAPYFASSIREFWSRWHISLSTWFRDYVYITLGGNRCSKVKNYRNLFITFLVSGLWHGANWTYVIWGAGHGILQILEKIFKVDALRTKTAKVLRIVIVFILCNILWVFFRASTISDALLLFKHLICDELNLYSLTHVRSGIGITTLAVTMVCILFLAVFDKFSEKEDVIKRISSYKLVCRWGIYVALVVGTYFIYVNYGVSNASFVYFQF